MDRRKAKRRALGLAAALLNDSIERLITAAPTLTGADRARIVSAVHEIADELHRRATGRADTSPRPAPVDPDQCVLDFEAAARARR